MPMARRGARAPPPPAAQPPAPAPGAAIGRGPGVPGRRPRPRAAASPAAGVVPAGARACGAAATGTRAAAALTAGLPAVGAPPGSRSRGFTPFAAPRGRCGARAAARARRAVGVTAVRRAVPPRSLLVSGARALHPIPRRLAVHPAVLSSPPHLSRWRAPPSPWPCSCWRLAVRGAARMHAWARRAAHRSPRGARTPPRGPALPAARSRGPQVATPSRAPRPLRSRQRPGWPLRRGERPDRGANAGSTGHPARRAARGGPRPGVTARSSSGPLGSPQPPQRRPGPNAAANPPPHRPPAPLPPSPPRS
jgi:hypothetical protein